MLPCAARMPMTILRFAVPAALLGAFLLLGERPAGPLDEIPSASFSSAQDDAAGSVPCPALLPGGVAVALVAVRLPPAAAARLQAEALSPEARSLSPPVAS